MFAEIVGDVLFKSMLCSLQRLLFDSYNAIVNGVSYTQVKSGDSGMQPNCLVFGNLWRVVRK